MPFSYLSARDEPIGYSIELCSKLGEAIGEAVGRELALKWLAVTSETRIEAITSGQADLECGSTTNNLERQKQVAFSPVIFVSGTKLLVKRGSPVTLVSRPRRQDGGRHRRHHQREGDAGDRAALQARFQHRGGARTMPSPTRSSERARRTPSPPTTCCSTACVAQNQAQKQYQVVGEFLSYDPYGIMFRKGDAQLAERGEARLPRPRRGRRDRAPVQALVPAAPARRAQSLDLPMSPQLETLIEAMGSPTE